MEILVRAECVRQRNEVAIKLGIISLSLLSPSCLLNLQERVIVGYPNFAWAPKSQKYEDSNEKIILETPLPP